MANLNVTIPVVNVEINGVQYAKVERAAQAGDVVQMARSGSDVRAGDYYDVYEAGNGVLHFKDREDDARVLSNWEYEVFAKVEAQPSAKFRKVERTAKKGDFVKFTGSLPSYLESEKYYEVIRLDGADDPHVIDEDGDDYDASNRTHEVYESVEALTYRKVDRDARVGDFVKFNEIDSSYDLTHGEYYKVVEIDGCNDAQIIDDAGDEFDTGGEDFDVYEKVVGEEAQFHEVNREAKVGELIKIVAAYGTGGRYKNGDSLVVHSVDSDGDVFVPIEYGVSTYSKFIARREYVVLEPIASEVAFEEGDKAKVVSLSGAMCGFTVGEIVTVLGLNSGAHKYEVENDTTIGYADSKHLAKIEKAEAKRRLTIGDYARIIELGSHSYEVGSVVHIVEDDHDDEPYKAKKADGSLGNYIGESEVERATEAEFLAQIKPTRLTVGDYARFTVDNSGHGHVIGTVAQIVTDDKSGLPYRARKGSSTGGWFRESEVERATEADFLAQVKPDSTTFQVGEVPLLGFKDGETYEIKNPSHKHSGGTRTQIEGGGFVGYARPDQLAKLTIEVGSNVKLTIKDGKQPYHGYGSVSNGDVGVVTRITGNEVKVNFPKQQYWNGLLSELTLVGVQEAVSPEAPTKRFEVGEYARVLVSGKDVAKGSIVEIKRDDRDHNPFAAYAIDGSDWDYFRQDELERDGSEELAKAKETAKWAKIGRKVNEYKVGDIVKFSKYRRAHGLNEFDGIMTEVTEINSSGIPVLAVPSFVSTDYGTNTPIEQVALITPVESRFDKEAA